VNLHASVPPVKVVSAAFGESESKASSGVGNIPDFKDGTLKLEQVI
jgi:hypothetical protein